LGIDNCEIHVNQVEMPGLDGSAQKFVDALRDAGLTTLDVPAA
jgi:UDP-3-O-acyl-N-acetylglucosamine deacetylase